MSFIFKQVGLWFWNWMELLYQIYNGGHISVSVLEWLWLSIFYFPYQSIKNVNDLLIRGHQLYKYITQYVRKNFIGSLCELHEGYVYAHNSGQFTLGYMVNSKLKFHSKIKFQEKKCITSSLHAHEQLNSLFILELITFVIHPVGGQC